MIPPFHKNPQIAEFNELKLFFRRHENSLSRRRMRMFRGYAKTLKEMGLEVAFDIMGSLNFGQWAPGSDVDLVLYLKCSGEHPEECMVNCDYFQRVQSQLKALHESEPDPGMIQVVDCINLLTLERELETMNFDSLLLIRFAFYRSVCRIIEAGIVRPYQESLLENPLLLEKMLPFLPNVFAGLSRSSAHEISLKKYQERLREESGVHIPDCILQKIQEHLEHTAPG